jgi:sugar phosphate isomerase/epimerase
MKTSRRKFLSNTSSLLFGGLIFKNNPAHGSLPSISDKNKVTVGAHPWVYAAELPPPDYDISPVLDDIFQGIKYAGFDGIELMHHPLRSHRTTLIISELKDRYGLPVIGTSYGADMWDKSKHQEILDDVENIINHLAEVGGRTLGTSVGRAPDKKTEKQLDDQADLLKKIIEIGKSRGVILNLHNHTYEVEDGLHDLKGTLKRIPEIKLGPDLNWLQRGGVDPESFLKKYSDQIVFMHLRDELKNGKWSESLGEGDVNFRSIGKILNKADFYGDLVVELAHEGDFEPTRAVRESLKMSREHVKKTMGY